MSDYNITKKDSNRRYDVLDEIKVGENEDMLVIHGADIDSDEQSFIFQHYGYQMLTPQRSKIIADLLVAKDERIAELEAALKPLMAINTLYVSPQIASVINSVRNALEDKQCLD